MPWTDQTWDAFCSLLEHGWPGPFPSEAGDAYRLLLDDVEPEATFAAVKTLIKQGKPFRPSVAEIAGEAIADPSKPTFDEALHAIRRVVPIHPDTAALERAEGIHPYLRAFIESVGLDRLRRWPIDDPEFGQLETKKLREAWDRFVERADHRTASGMEIDTPVRRQLGPHKPDFKAALPAGGTA